MCVMISRWRPSLVHFSYICFCFSLFLNTLFTICPCVTKNESVFCFLDQECISKPVKCFLSQNGHMRSLLVFKVGYILNDKNTLCNGCKLTGWSVLISESSFTRTMFISKYVTDYKFLQDVHKDSLHIPRQKNRFLCNRPDEPLKASKRPAVSSRLRWRRPDVRATLFRR
jgi:hypothetical protein